MITIVTGTDTGVGKTIATAALAATSGPGTLVVKPVQTGVGPDVADIAVVERLAGCAVAEFTRLADPLAPDTAARLRGVEIPPIAEHAARIRDLEGTHGSVIVEGSGGLLVRLDTAGGTLLDLARDLAGDQRVEIQVVTRPGLGTLNHTELTVAALRARDLEPAGLILGAAPSSGSPAEEHNRTELPRLTGVPLTAAIPEGAATLTPDQFRKAAADWMGGSFARDCPDGTDMITRQL